MLYVANDCQVTPALQLLPFYSTLHKRFVKIIVAALSGRHEMVHVGTAYCKAVEGYLNGQVIIVE